MSAKDQCGVFNVSKRLNNEVILSVKDLKWIFLCQPMKPSGVSERLNVEFIYDRKRLIVEFFYVREILKCIFHVNRIIKVKFLYVCEKLQVEFFMSAKDSKM